MWPALILLSAALFALIYGIHSMMPERTQYDCTIAEISPDYTTAMKEECRRLRRQQYDSRSNSKTNS